MHGTDIFSRRAMPDGPEILLKHKGNAPEQISELVGSACRQRRYRSRWDSPEQTEQVQIYTTGAHRAHGRLTAGEQKTNAAGFTRERGTGQIVLLDELKEDPLGNQIESAIRCPVGTDTEKECRTGKHAPPQWWIEFASGSHNDEPPDKGVKMTSPHPVEETRQSFVSSLRAAARHPSGHLSAIRPKGCDADYLADLVAADRHDENPTRIAPAPLTSRDSLAALGAYGGTLAGLAISSSDIPADLIDDILDSHHNGLRDKVVAMAASALGMSESDARDYFLEHVASDKVESALMLGEISYAMAADVFASYTKTGRVDWDGVL